MTIVPSTSPPSAPHPPSRGRRRWLPWAVAIVVAATGLGILWANAPLDRRRVLLRQPIKLIEGATASGSFTPEHDGPFLAAIELTRDRPAEELAALVGGGFFLAGTTTPPGFAISYTIRNGTAPLATGSTGSTFTGSHGRDAASVVVADVSKGLAEPSTVEIRVDRAGPRLDQLDAALSVEASGDWISYAWLEAELRLVLVLVVASLSMVAIAIVAGVQRRRSALARPTSISL